MAFKTNTLQITFSLSKVIIIYLDSNSKNAITPQDVTSTFSQFLIQCGPFRMERNSIVKL